MSSLEQVKHLVDVGKIIIYDADTGEYIEPVRVERKGYFTAIVIGGERGRETARVPKYWRKR